jgi:AcrR family transcriptional regulator
MAPDESSDRGEQDLNDSPFLTELLLARLPSGRHGLPRSFIAQNQRFRIAVAMLRVLPKRGYAETTIGDIAAEGNVSRTAFYEHFKDKEACFLETFDLCASWFCEQVEAAVAGEDDWRGRVRTGATEALRLLATNPLVAHLFAVEAAQAGLHGRERRDLMLQRFATVLRADHPGRTDLPDDLADMLLGGFVTLVARYVDRGRTEQLPEATRGLVEYLLIPYLGGEEASALAGEMPAG